MKIEIICAHCGGIGTKEKGEVTRSKSLGRKLFCTQSCATKFLNAQRRKNGEKIGSQAHLRRGSTKDEYSPFRFFLSKIRARHKKKGFAVTDIDLVFLKGLWEEQAGTCPFTGWKMTLLACSSDWNKGSGGRPETASLDRINSELGYQKGNVRFVSYIANLCKHNFSDEDVTRFALAVVG